MAGEQVSAAIEAAARESYGRLLGFLAGHAGDLASAEDALSDAFLAALRQWPLDGLPQRPEAWLLSVARRRLIDSRRRLSTRLAAMDDLSHAFAAAEQAVEAADDFPDKRLELLFVCAHPAIDPTARVPLMLQTVLGFEAARIARLFVVSPASMGKRLVRAKTKIRAARIAFQEPAKELWAERLAEVLEAVYAAYGVHWEKAAGAEPTEAGPAEEALHLARLLTRLLPGEPEALGLLSLLLYLHSRSRARRDFAGRYVPLDEQDPAEWDPALLSQAETALSHAAASHTLGRFQLEAAIQSVHAQRARTGRIDWRIIAELYQALLTHWPSVGAHIARAVALSRAEGAPAGWAALDALPATQVAECQPYWAARADLLAQLGRITEAQAAYTRAIALTTDEPSRGFLEERRRTGA